MQVAQWQKGMSGGQFQDMSIYVYVMEPVAGGSRNQGRAPQLFAPQLTG